MMFSLKLTDIFCLKPSSQNKYTGFLCYELVLLILIYFDWFGLLLYLKVCGSQSFSCLKRCGLDDCDDCSVEQDVSSVNPLPNDYYLDIELDDCKMSIQSFYLKFTTTLTNFKNVYEQKEHDLKKLLSKVSLFSSQTYSWRINFVGNEIMSARSWCVITVSLSVIKGSWILKKLVGMQAGLKNSKHGLSSLEEKAQSSLATVLNESQAIATLREQIQFFQDNYTHSIGAIEMAIGFLKNVFQLVVHIWS